MFVVVMPNRSAERTGPPCPAAACGGGQENPSARGQKIPPPLKPLHFCPFAFRTDFLKFIYLVFVLKKN